MSQSKGQSRPLSLPRRLVMDLLHFARNVPLIPMERTMRLQPLVLARRRATPYLGWCALFTKAFAINSARRPELRDSYLPYPWPRLYRHDDSIATIIVERQLDGENVLLPYYMRNADQQTLPDIQVQLNHAKTAPFESINSFHRTLLMGRYPGFIRRSICKLVLNWWGRKRAKRFGTFAVSATAAMGAGQLAVISPTTCTLHYGLLEADGSLPVRITFDHRVLDGADVARVLAELEGVLLEEILPEVRELDGVDVSVLHPLTRLNQPYKHLVPGSNYKLLRTKQGCY